MWVGSFVGCGGGEVGGEVGVGFGNVLEEMGDGNDIYRVTGNI